uniref:Uncharacterized protein n=1 Tax=Cacopsylla melanoneura TaxID=428564 RepID=A0A8D8LT99_9HEMI
MILVGLFSPTGIVQYYDEDCFKYYYGDCLVLYEDCLVLYEYWPSYCYSETGIDSLGNRFHGIDSFMNTDLRIAFLKLKSIRKTKSLDLELGTLTCCKNCPSFIVQFWYDITKSSVYKITKKNNT